MNDKHSNSYEERLEALNWAESMFEFWCQGNNIWYTRMGFDETNGTVPMFYKLNPIIRSLPDYIMEWKNKLIYIHVKGTNKLKVHDLEQYLAFESLFCTDETPLILAFVFKENDKPIFKNLRWIENEIKEIPIKVFPSDDKEYYDLRI